MKSCWLTQTFQVCRDVIGWKRRGEFVSCVWLVSIRHTNAPLCSASFSSLPSGFGILDRLSERLANLEAFFCFVKNSSALFRRVFSALFPLWESLKIPNALIIARARDVNGFNVSVTR